MGTFITEPTAAQTDADSPVNESLMSTAIRDSLIDLDAELAEVYDGTQVETDKVVTDSIAAAAVDRAELGTGQEEQSQSTTAVTLSGNLTFSSTSTYGFHPEIRAVHPNNLTDLDAQHALSRVPGTTDSGYLISMYVSSTDGGGPGSTRTNYARLRYVTATPPNFVGSIEAEASPFLFVLRDASTGQQLRAWLGDDPPGQLRHVHPLIYPTPGRKSPHAREVRLALKRDPRAWHRRPHPFVDDFPELPPGSEVILVDPRVWLEKVEHLPMAAELARWRSGAEELSVMGESPDAMAAMEAALSAAAEKEAADASRARVLLDGADEFLAAAQRQEEARWAKRDAVYASDWHAARRARVAAEKALDQAQHDLSLAIDTAGACEAELARIASGGAPGDVLDLPHEDAERRVALGPKIRDEAMREAEEQIDPSDIGGVRSSMTRTGYVEALTSRLERENAAALSLTDRGAQLRSRVAKARSAEKAAASAREVGADPAVRDKRRDLVERKARAMLRRAEAQSGRVPLHLALAASDPGESRLEAMQKHAEFLACSRCLGTSPDLSDHRMLPAIRGLFSRGMAGEAPRVRFMTK